MAAKGFANDPHSEQGSACPRNFFGYTDYVQLSSVERVYGARRLGDLLRNPLPGNFDPPHLRKIHWYLFRDVFPWAGELRVVGLAKPGGAPFAAPAHIASALAETLGRLKEENYLHSLPQAAFADRAAFYLGEINAIHPFREGNGRTQREFIRQLAAQAGHVISWEGFTQEQMTVASILSHTQGNNSELANILRAAIQPVSEPEDSR